MLHAEVTTSVTRSRAAVAKAANRGELPRRIQFRRKFRIRRGHRAVGRRIGGGVGWQKSGGIANLDRVTRGSPARGEVGAESGSGCGLLPAHTKL